MLAVIVVHESSLFDSKIYVCLSGFTGFLKYLSNGSATFAKSGLGKSGELSRRPS